MKPYFDNMYNMRRSNARCVRQEWFCGKCNKPIYGGIYLHDVCPHCEEPLTDKEIALQKAQDRFGKWVTL